MNVYITSKDIDIQGFTVIKVGTNQFNFDEIPKNSCENLVVEDAIEYFDDISGFCQGFFSLLRKGGVVKIIGLDLHTMSLNYVSGQLNSKTFNEVVVSGKQAVLSMGDVLQMVKELDMVVEKCDLNEGSMYEIVARRK
jgi:hypothetical protein